MKKGFTLVELLLAFGLSGIVFMLVSSFMMTLMTSSSKSKRWETFDSLKNAVSMEVSGAVRWGKVVVCDGSSLTVDGKNYHLDSGKFLRNEEVLTPEGVVLSNMQVVDHSGTGLFAACEIQIDMEDRYASLIKDKMKIVVSQRKIAVGGEP